MDYIATLEIHHKGDVYFDKLLVLVEASNNCESWDKARIPASEYNQSHDIKCVVGSIKKAPTIELPQPIPGELEHGVQVDMFGVQHRFTPRGRGQLTQISMDDQLKLEMLKKEAMNG